MMAFTKRTNLVMLIMTVILRQFPFHFLDFKVLYMEYLHLFGLLGQSQVWKIFRPTLEME